MQREKGKKKKKKKKKANKRPSKGQPQPRGGRAKQKDKAATKKVRCTTTRLGSRPARPGQQEHAQAHTHGTPVWRPPTRKGRCLRPHETAAVHRPSPPSNNGRYGKADASVTESTHAKPPQRTQPRTGARGTHQGQPHRGAPNGYDAERPQRPCLGGGQQQAQ